LATRVGTLPTFVVETSAFGTYVTVQQGIAATNDRREETAVHRLLWRAALTLAKHVSTAHRPGLLASPWTAMLQGRRLGGKVASTYLGWPSLSLRRGSLEATLVPSCGGRVLQLSVAGVELFYAEPRPPSWPPSPADRRYWGGDKTWLAPQSAWGSPFPEPRILDEGEYEVLDFSA
jgi:hypothetical protein